MVGKVLHNTYISIQIVIIGIGVAPSTCQLGLMTDLDKAILQELGTSGVVEDSGELASRYGQDHLVVVGVLKSLEAAEMITMQVGWSWLVPPLPPHPAASCSTPAVLCAGYQPPAIRADRRVEEIS